MITLLWVTWPFLLAAERPSSKEIMTYRFNVNNVITGSGVSGNDGDIVVYNFKTFMKSASPSGPGWTVTRSGDGLAAFSSTGDVITSSGTGANGIGNTNSWFVLQSPNGSRQILWQRGTANSSWVILYSKGSLFTGGTASSRATATDAAVVLGSTTDPSTAAGSTHFSTTTKIVHYGADDTDGYSFYYAGYHQTTLATSAGGLYFDEVIPLDTNIDNDYYIFFVNAGNSTNEWTTQGLGAENSLANTFRVAAWLYAGTPFQTFGITPGAQWRSNGTNNVVIPGSISQNLYTLRDIAFPIFYCHRNGPVFTNTFDTVGFKGVGMYMMQKGNSLATASTMSINFLRDYIVIGDCVLPFNGSVPST